MDELEGVAALRQLVADRFVLALIGQLKARYANAGSAAAEDAVAAAVERVLKRIEKGPPIDDVKKYLARVAYNEMNRALGSNRLLEVELEERDDVPQPSAESEAMRSVALELIKAEVRSWENANIRTVTLIYVEAAIENDPLSTDEVAELASDVLGYEIDPGSVRTWKMRGFRKLRQFVDEAQGFAADGEKES